MGIPYRRVANFDSILRSIEGEAFPPGSFLQIVREGLMDLLTETGTQPARD